ncbi:hypothetical protein E2C01_091232 [Portunus trituberculatus]|uniref:Uncharacterized protein n=1 Tax=Portunus trituberculatus TaxID=210409 RepID=A0A5B7JMF4_PORTR|nr:hypothetical protein [Portunus trituberculatus]
MHNFFTHQLYPAVQALGIHLTLDLLPHPDGGCQPGSSKCLGSSLMVCAAEALPLTTAQLAFSTCFMKGTLGLQDQSYPAVMNVAKMDGGCQPGSSKCLGSSLMVWSSRSAVNFPLS